MKNKFSYFFIVLFFLILLSSCKSDIKTLPYFNTAEFTPQWMTKEQIVSSKMHTIDEFAFRDQNNNLITNKDFEGKIYIANFFFTTCPGICPQMTANMALLQSYYADDDRIKFISHTVTPWIDTVEQLRRYADEYDINPKKWHLVTGSKKEIYDLARNSYFVEKEIGLQLGTDDFLHTENFILVDHHGHIRGIYNGTILSELERIKADISTLNNN
jgi:protein SCO1/2